MSLLQSGTANFTRALVGSLASGGRPEGTGSAAPTTNMAASLAATASLVTVSPGASEESFCAGSWPPRTSDSGEPFDSPEYDLSSSTCPRRSPSPDELSSLSASDSDSFWLAPGIEEASDS